MTPEKWQQLEAIYDRALKLRPEDRRSFADRACGADSELRRELQKLLDGYARAEEQQLLDQAAWRINAANMKEDAMKGRIVGDIYLIKEKISEGGFGEVYKAVGLVEGRETGNYVIKIAKYSDDDSKRRFKEEVRILADLKHKNIPPAIYWNDVDGRPYFVMEFLNGTNLTEFINQNKRGHKGLDPSTVAEITRQACNGLQAAHDNGVIHRDIKPENIMIEQSDGNVAVKLIDFGLAKAADAITRKATQGIIGSFNYISPEQIDPDSFGIPDHRCDIYAMGLVIYQMLTGRIAFTGDTKMLINKQLNQMPPSPGINARVDQVVMKAVKKRPAERQSSAKELADELDAAIRDVPPPSPGPVPNGKQRRQMLIGAAALLLVVASVFAYWNWPIVVKNGEPTPTPAVTPSIVAPTPAIAKAIPQMTIYQQTAAGGAGDIVPEKVFTSNDKLRFTVTPPEDGFIYLVQRGSRGDLTLLYPDPKNGLVDNAVIGGRPVFFPPADDQRLPDWFNFDKTPGTETVYAVFAKEKRGQLPDLIEEGIRLNRRNPPPLRQILLDEGVEVLAREAMESPGRHGGSVSKLVFNHK